MLKRLIALVEDDWGPHVGSLLRRSLRWFLADGVFGGASDAIVNAFQALYFLALGATRPQIGLLASLSNLTMPLAMFPGAALAERSVEYKRFILKALIFSKSTLFLLALLPFIPFSGYAISFGIGIATLRVFASHFANPAWTALVGKLVPLQWRGRYFASRNILIGLASVLVTLLAGGLIDLLGSPGGYQVVFGLAGILGLLSAYSFARIEEPLMAQRRTQNLSTKAVLKFTGRIPGFLPFCILSGLWNFSVHLAAPFFPVYMVEGFKAGGTLIGLTSSLAILASIPGQRIFGRQADERGALWVQRLTSLVIPFIPWLWALAPGVWFIIPVELFSGFIWAGFNLAVFNLLLELTPEEGRPVHVALYQVISGLGMTIGPVIGGLLANALGYKALFWISGALRVLIAILFIHFLREGSRP
ncbi:MAG: MFS transporter [Anaerolineae bacterium]|nr:MFS transporter [Anaerolineae bacterium]MDW8102219.1 MFS transporter [Anaerolineae bacterium]